MEVEQLIEANPLQFRALQCHQKLRWDFYP